MNDTPDDTIPPPSGSKPTIPTPPPSEAPSSELPPIPRGEAEAYLSAVCDDMVAAYKRLEAVAFAMARQLDAEAGR